MCCVFILFVSQRIGEYRSYIFIAKLFYRNNKVKKFFQKKHLTLFFFGKITRIFLVRSNISRILKPAFYKKKRFIRN